MTILCLYFPKLATELACRRHPQLRGRGIVFLDGSGDDALVAGRSSEAASRGVILGMTSGEARRRAPDIAFLPANSTKIREQLARMATELSTQLGLMVTIGQDSLMVPVAAGAPLERGNEHYIARLSQAVASEFGFAVVAGTGATADEAVAMARSAARRPQPLLAIG